MSAQPWAADREWAGVEAGKKNNLCLQSPSASPRAWHSIDGAKTPAMAASRPAKQEHWFDYHGASIYRQDADLLRPGQWLNDTLITFAVDYIAHELARDAESWEFCHSG